MTAWPVRADPVTETICTSGSRTMASPISAPPVTMFKTPDGSPASAASSARRRVDRGVFGAGFSTMVLPAARAGPIFQIAMTKGKFQGAMLPTTPIGRRTSMEVYPLLSTPAPVPSSDRPEPAKKRRLSAAKGSSPSAKTAVGLPVSSTSRRVSSPESDSMRSARRSRIRARSPGVRPAQSPKAAAAAAVASPTSSADAGVIAAEMSPVAGFTRSWRSPRPERVSPLMWTPWISGT